MKRRFIILSFLVVLTRFLDSASTFLAAPDLANELNPVTRFFNGGWISLILINSIVTAIFIYLLYYHFFKYKQLNLKNTPKTIKNFIGEIYYNDSTKFNYIFTKIPNNKIPLKGHLAYIFPVSSIYYSFIVIVNNLLIAFAPNKYFSFLQIFNLQTFPHFIYFIYLPIFFTIYYFILNREYKNAKV